MPGRHSTVIAADYRGGRVREDQAGRRGVRADGRPGVAGRFRRPEGPRREGAAGVRPADAAGCRRRRPQRPAARGPSPRGRLLAAGDPTGSTPAAGPAHCRLVGHSQPAHRPARRRACRPDPRTARRRTSPCRPRRTAHPSADGVRRATARSGNARRGCEACRPCVRQSAAGPHARPAHRLRRAGPHHRRRNPRADPGRRPGPRTGPLEENLSRQCAHRWGPNPSAGRHRSDAAHPADRDRRRADPDGHR